MAKSYEPRGVISAGGILDEIVAAKALRVLAARGGIEGLGPRPNLAPMERALSRPDRVNVIAEIKRRSPSKGVIRREFDPVAIALGYAGHGAAALSVLTEEDYFGGSLDHLRMIREAVDLPILRKDFIFDESQIHESAAAGADAVLLITAILGDELLIRLLRLAHEAGLDALVEVHTRHELERAIKAGAGIIGVNNRDLTTFTVELENSIELAPLARQTKVLVSESGIRTGDDIKRLRAAGFSAFLVGEHLMKAVDPGRALGGLIEEAGS